VTTTTMHTSTRGGPLEALKRLLKEGFGYAQFVVGNDGSLAHAATVITVEPKVGESEAAFLSRLQTEYELQPGDDVKIRSHGKKIKVAEITIHPS